ncbi:MAG TPA: ATP-binding protein [Gammaproteobacteria bacterium]|jgi:two-component system sensor kinase FixL
MSTTLSGGSQEAAFGSEFHALLSAAVDAIVLIDAKGKIIAFNPAAEKLFEYDSDEIRGQPVQLLMPEPYRSEHADYLERYLRTGTARIIGTGREVQGQKKSGEVFPIWLTVGEANAAGQHRFVGIIRDLSAQHAAEHEQRALEARLTYVGRFSLMGEMAAGIAHEINQPLSAIANYSQAAKRLLALEPLDKAILSRACAGIAEQVQRAGQVIQNLRSFIRQQEIKMEELLPNEVIEGAMTLVEVDAKDAGMKLVTELADDLPSIHGNAVQLQQVLLNLTRNAVDAMKASPQKNKELKITTRRSTSGAVEFRVSDRGPGVSPRLAENIFHPFVTTKRDGLGVGLAISRTIVEAHGGQLNYRPNPEGGAIFVVTLPPPDGKSHDD